MSAPGRTATDEALEVAAQHLGAGRYAAAASICETLLTDEPSNLRALNLFAGLKARTGEVSAAVEILEHALQVDDRYAETFSNLGALHITQQRFDDARIAIERALQLDPGNVGFRANLAVLELKHGDAARGAAMLEEAVCDAPESAMAWFNVSQARLRNGDRAGAEAALRRAVELDPDKAEAWNNLGNVLGEAGRHREAIETLEKALLRDPESLITLMNLADLQTLTGRLAAAERNIKRLKVLQPKNPMLPLAEGRLHLAAGRYAEAEPCFVDAMRRLPEAPMGAYGHALLMRRIGRPADAARSVATAIEIAGAFVPARWLACELALARGDLAGAWAQCRAVGTPDPGAEATLAAFEAPGSLDGRVVTVDCSTQVAWAVRAARFLPRLVAAGARIRLSGLPELCALVGSAIPDGGRVWDAADDGAAEIAAQPWHLPLLAGVADDVAADRPAYLAPPAHVRGMVAESLDKLPRPMLVVCLPWVPDPTLDPAMAGFWEAALTALPRRAGSTVVVGALPPGSAAEPTAFVREPDPAELAALALAADAVVAVDAWPAEVVAAAGRPVHVAVPCQGSGVWGEAGATTPWYPTARIYRPAPPDDWAAATEAMTRAVRDALGLRALDGDAPAP